MKFHGRTPRRPFSFLYPFILGIAFLVPFGFPVLAQEGPQTGSGDSVAKPRTKPADEPAPEEKQIPSEYKRKNEPAEDTPTFRTNATTVNVDVAVLDDRGHFIPKIPGGNFRVLEDGVPQQIANFGMSEAPMTICMLIEFSGRFQAFWTYGWYETLQASYGFLETLKPDDNIAVVEYDMRSTILSDFSPDKHKAEQALSQLRIPGFSESNVFDALTDMADRMSAIEGRKAILLIGSGLDTFSKLTFDKARKSLQESGVPIYTISTLQTSRILAESYGMMGPIAQMDFLQADNEMRTFSKETGGMSFFPRFLAEYPSIFRQLEDSLRNQYSVAYHPTNVARDGKFRRIKVELVNPATNEPLRITNEKGKAIKYQVIAKAGYKAPREVE
ncbi:MAG: VWA domain-containing protein [Acidobacteriaceae bacterium]|nr:VWA domain-containing protein [Acidobacteriaceae bacterium]